MRWCMGSLWVGEDELLWWRGNRNAGIPTHAIVKKYDNLSDILKAFKLYVII